jgi:hypothetical protein
MESIEIRNQDGILGYKVEIDGMAKSLGWEGEGGLVWLDRPELANTI